MQTKLRLLYIYSEIAIKGGTDKVLVEKTNYLSQHGYEVLVVTESQMGRPLSFPLHPDVRHIDMGLDFNKQYTQGTLRRVFTYYTLMREYAKRLKALLYREKPDIVICTMGRSIDFITGIHDGSKKIAEAHTTKQHLRSLHLMEQRGGWHKYAARYLRAKMCRRCVNLDAMVLLTSQDADDWKEVRRRVVIPNAVPFVPTRTSDLSSKQVIMVGRYNDAKGYDYLIPAWELVHKKHPDWTLNVYGSGELHDQVVQWIHERSLENSMILHDPVGNIMDKYLESSICVLSSRYEGFSLVILEGMSCGVPFVSFDCPYGPRNIIRNGEDGLLVNYLDSQALADGINHLIEDENYRRQLGTQARKNIMRFSKESVMKQWDEFFKSLVKRRK